MRVGAGEKEGWPTIRLIFLMKQVAHIHHILLSSQVSYLCGCHYDRASGSLSLVAGTNDGSAAFFPLHEHTPSSADAQRGGTASAAGTRRTGATLAAPVMALHGAHTKVVRSVRCFSGAQVRAAFRCVRPEPVPIAMPIRPGLIPWRGGGCAPVHIHMAC